MKLKPDHWYRQSSVIPFRKNSGHLELLVISTRKKKKWIFPKGIIEQGLSPQKSAEKEALEEAGIKGDILPNSFGTYEVEKWGGICMISVYALNVKNTLDKWEEDFRDRKWINADDVGKYLNNKDLLNIVDYFYDQIINTEI